MAEGEVQQTINEIREAADNLAEIDIADVVARLHTAANHLNDLLSDGGATSDEDVVEDETETEDEDEDAGSSL